jgi:hypothetical protein
MSRLAALKLQDLTVSSHCSIADDVVMPSGRELMAAVGPHQSLTRLQLDGFYDGLHISLQGDDFAPVMALAACLQDLQLYRALLPVDVLQTLRSFPQLRSLGLSGCLHHIELPADEQDPEQEEFRRLAWAGLSHLTQLRSLSILMDDRDHIEELFSLTGLTWLHVYYNGMLPEDMWKLVSMQQLEVLRWAGDDVRAADLPQVCWAALQHLPKLRKVSWGMCATMDASGIRHRAAAAADAEAGAD